MKDDGWRQEKVDDIRAKGSEEGRTAEGIQMDCLYDLLLYVADKIK